MTTRVLVAYGTKHEATAEIAEEIGRVLRDRGLDVDVERARDVRSVDEYAAVVVGSAVYMGRWRRDAMRLLRRQRHALASRDVWIFNSGPIAASDEEEAEQGRWTRPKRVEAAAAEIGAHEPVVFGGSVEESGSVMRRNMAKGLPADRRDRRDWDAIRAWAGEIASSITRGDAASSR